MLYSGKKKEDEVNLQELQLDHLSPSSISTFLDSPLRWKNHYIDGLPDDYSESLHRGIVTHTLLEEFFTYKLTGFPVEDIPGWVADRATKLWTELKENREGGFEDTPTIQTQIVQLVTDYLSTVAKEIVPVSVEVPFSFPITGQKLTSLIGRTDLVATIANQLWIIDFKTSTRKRSDHDTLNDLQAIIYGLAAKKGGYKGDVLFSYHQFIFRKQPEIVVLNRPISQAEMRDFEENFLPGFVRTLEFMIKSDSWYFNPQARYGKGA